MILMCNKHKQMHNNNKAYDSVTPRADSWRYRNLGVPFDKLDLMLPPGFSYKGQAKFIIIGPNIICFWCAIGFGHFFNHNSKCLNNMIVFVNVYVCYSIMQLMPSVNLGFIELVMQNKFSALQFQCWWKDRGTHATRSH